MPELTKEKGVYSYKLVILGHYSVGKSSLALNYVKGLFNPNEESTIGAAFLTKTVLSKKDHIKFEIWDTAGQERYNSLIPMYYRGAHVAIIVYDITSYESYKTAKNWVNELNAEKPADFIKVLVGNKTDLESMGRQVETEEAAAYSAEKGLLFYETSAKTGYNVNKLFGDIADVVPRAEENKPNGEVSIKDAGKKYTCC
ncbi:Ras-related protein Rab-5A [Astathelohania contejeani]|uniref:Ras-related protein Rab-5A n=1 Tax=Astathelohania contejeani TaxID=164912 RepID=A0ABQ7HW66_9MICR|nr:Ras-related protein Rab-5A [Thelohania contejeani]